MQSAEMHHFIGESCAPVSEHTRQFLAVNYGFDLTAEMRVDFHQPNLVYVISNGFCQCVDLNCSMIQSPTSIPTMVTNPPPLVMSQPVLAYGRNLSVCPATPPFVQVPSQVVEMPPSYAEVPQNVPVKTAKPSSKKVVRKKHNHVEEQKSLLAEPSLQSHNASIGEETSQDSVEWRCLTDVECEQLHRERRKALAYKTALCQEFKNTGSCEYGDSCSFAHDESELRPPPPVHPKYKTILCNKFSVNGCCPYGARCQFIHARTNSALQQESSQDDSDRLTNVCNKIENMSILNDDGTNQSRDEEEILFSQSCFPRLSMSPGWLTRAPPE